MLQFVGVSLTAVAPFVEGHRYPMFLNLDSFEMTVPKVVEHYLSLVLPKSLVVDQEYFPNQT